MISSDDLIKTNNSSKASLITINTLIEYGQTKIKDNVVFLNGIDSDPEDYTKKVRDSIEKKTEECFDWMERVANLLDNKNVIQVGQEEVNTTKQLIEQFNENFDEYSFTEILGHLVSIRDNLQVEKSGSVDKKNDHRISDNSKVFIVHGHSQLLIFQTEAFLRKLQLEPIILRDQVNQGQTIIEKLEKYTDVAFAIVLYTACDFGCAKEEKGMEDKLRPRARQNVVFEHGYLNAKLGRNRVCALVEEGVEEPSDLAGVVYIPIDPNGAWMIKVADEMKAAGLNVDKNKL